MRRHLRFCADGRRIKRRLSNKKFLLFIGKQYQSAMVGFASGGMGQT